MARPLASSSVSCTALIRCINITAPILISDYNNSTVDVGIVGFIGMSQTCCLHGLLSLWPLFPLLLLLPLLCLGVLPGSSFHGHGFHQIPTATPITGTWNIDIYARIWSQATKLSFESEKFRINVIPAPVTCARNTTDWQWNDIQQQRDGSNFT